MSASRTKVFHFAHYTDDGRAGGPRVCCAEGDLPLFLARHPEFPQTQWKKNYMRGDGKVWRSEWARL